MWNTLFLDSEVRGLQNWQEDGVQLVGEVCAIPSGGSGRGGVRCSTEPSPARCSTMCRNGSKRQYLTCALKPSLLKTAGTEQMSVLQRGGCLECKTCMVFVAGGEC